MEGGSEGDLHAHHEQYLRYHQVNQPPLLMLQELLKLLKQSNIIMLEGEGSQLNDIHENRYISNNDATPKCHQYHTQLASYYKLDVL